MDRMVAAQDVLGIGADTQVERMGAFERLAGVFQNRLDFYRVPRR
jgi:hypothetical protein